MHARQVITGELAYDVGREQELFSFKYDLYLH